MNVAKHSRRLLEYISTLMISRKPLSRKETEDTFTLEYFDSEHAIPVYSVRVDSGLGFSVAIFGWFYLIPMNYIVNLSILCCILLLHHCVKLSSHFLFVLAYLKF